MLANHRVNFPCRDDIEHTMKSTRTVLASILILALLAIYLPTTVGATTVTITGFQIQGWRWGGTTARLRIYASKAFTDSTGVPVMGGSVGSSTGFFKEIDCTIAANVLSIPTFTLPSTTDAFDATGASYTGVLFDSQNRARDTLFKDYRLPTTPNPITWLQWTAFNRANTPVRDTQTYNKTEVNNLIQAAVPSPPASVAGNGVARTDVDPTDALNPVMVVENSPLVRQFNVEKYGANPLTAGDDTAGVVAANAALIAAGGGELVFSPTSGEYKISSAVTIKSGTTVRCGAASYPFHPFDDETQPTGACKIRLTVAGASAASPAAIFFVGENTLNFKFQGLTLIADSLTHTRGVRMYGQKPNSSFNATFEGNFFYGFDRAISAEDNNGGTAETVHWQIDNLTILRNDFHSNNFGLWSNTANATNWNMIGNKFDIVDGVEGVKGYAAWMEQGSHWNFLENQFIGFGVHPEAAVYVGVSAGYLKFDNCSQEGPDLFIDTEDSPVGNSSSPIVFISNFITNIRLRHSRQMVFIGNTFNDPNSMTNTANAGNVTIYAIGNAIRGPGASVTQQAGSPFGGLTGSGHCITELNGFNNRVCANGALGMTITGPVGLGNRTPAQTLTDTSRLTVGLTGAQGSAGIAFVRFIADNELIYGEFFRHPTTGRYHFVATQTAANGLNTNGPMGAAYFEFLQSRQVADAVTNSTTTLTSATAAFVAGDVSAVVVITNGSLVLRTIINSVGAADTVTLQNAVPWSASGNTLTIYKPNGARLTSGPGAPGLPCGPGSTHHRTDGGATTSLYVCYDSGGGVGAWQAK